MTLLKDCGIILGIGCVGFTFAIATNGKKVPRVVEVVEQPAATVAAKVEEPNGYEAAERMCQRLDNTHMISDRCEVSAWRRITRA